MKNLSLRDRWKRWNYLQWVDTWLVSLPRRRRREVLAELRQNLGAAAGDVGMTSAIVELGEPRALAASYLDTEPRRGPRWDAGLVAMLVVVTAWVIVTAVYVMGALGALGASETADSVTLHFLGVRIVAENSSTALAAKFSGWPWITLVSMLLAFAIFSRCWRLLHRRPPETAPLT